MVVVDIVGLLFTVVLVGVRYPHYVLAAAMIHEVGRIAMTVFLHQHIELLVAAGAFGKTTINNQETMLAAACIAVSGPLANYIVSAVVGGIEYERGGTLLNPLARLKHPFGVVNLRLAVVSFVLSMIQLL
ncbi:hypothetical protein [Propionispora vibrioides]|uniref:Uncharacterized protein n=1 Tax=Propionispora vibrioides TaxID=112903 RepID=A0A1H8P2A0_9FIRM|nr:hypothetical protein [Propionispora vibrioides]SEO36086.1 hypothetical protein SAMN04490178_101314 [Propionispora vibrioides]